MGGVLFLITFIPMALTALYLAVLARKHKGNVKRGVLQSVPLLIPYKEFHLRFKEQVSNNRFYFCGEIEEDGKFWLYYYPPGAQFTSTWRYEWYHIEGGVLENEVTYKYMGYGTFRTEKFEQERLLNKLKELAS